jgi:hypothetical protein
VALIDENPFESYDLTARIVDGPLRDGRLEIAIQTGANPVGGALLNPDQAERVGVWLIGAALLARRGR